MKNDYYRVYAQIDLDAIEYNIDQMQRNMEPDVKMFAVIKTDGYGHGAVPIARLLEDRKQILGYAVATLEEALILRRCGIKKKILILGYTFPEQYEQLVKADVSPVVFRYDMAKAMSDTAGRLNRKVKMHLKLDTGMRRIGLQPDEEGFLEAKKILSLPNLHAEGIFTHFAKADEKDKTSACEQLRIYRDFVDRLERAGFSFDIHHCANSAGIIDMKDAHMDAVRAGISLYGLYPSGQVNKRAVPLKPALSLKSRVVHVKTVPSGLAVSYGGTYVTDRTTVIATIPVGYGDGYPRMLSNKGYVLIRGKRAPIIGRVCMDQFMVDVTDIPGVSMGDPVTLIGTDGEASVSVDELGDLCGRFSYEFLCDLGKRIPRIYSRHGEWVAKRDSFQCE